MKGTTELGILYKKGGEESLFAYSDSDYAGDLDGRKSTSGYVFKMSSGAVAWSSKKQPVVSLSTTEAEFIVAAACACQSVYGCSDFLGSLDLSNVSALYFVIITQLLNSRRILLNRGS